MKRSKFSARQIVYGLRQAVSGTPIRDLGLQYGIAEQSFYVWMRKYAHLGVSVLRRLRQLEEENSRLKRLVADFSLDKHMMSEALRKTVLGPPPGIGPLFSGHLLGEWCVGLSTGSVWPSLWYRKCRRKDQTALRLWIRNLAHACPPRFGYLRILVLLRREGWLVNRKRVRRLYRLDGLPLRTRVRRRKHMALHRGRAPVPVGPIERWSMNVLLDTLADGRPFRILMVGAHWSRCSPVREARFRTTGETVSQVLDRNLGADPVPRSVTVDHGTEFQSRALEDWAYRRGGRLAFIRPGKPVENALIESFNGRLRDECLNGHQFAALAEAQTILDAWRVDYNQHHSHSSLGHLTTNEVVMECQAEQIAEEVVCSS